MNGSQNKPTERQAILIAMQNQLDENYFVWDGQDEDDKPLTREEMLAGMVKNSKNSADKTEVALQLDNDILNYFRATNTDWQIGINDALREWLKNHSAA